MAFLAPLAAGAAVPATAGASALAGLAGTAGAASTGLASGLAAGATLGSGAAMSAMPALSYAGANLAAPGILGALPSAVAPTAGIFSQAAPALGGLKSLATPGIFSQASPALGGLKSFAPLTSQISPTLAGGAYNPAYAEMLGKQFAANSFPAGSPDVARTMLASTDKIAPITFKTQPVPKFLNTFQEGAALPGVTSNLPGQTFGGITGGPAIPGVTSGLPSSTIQTGLMPPSIAPTVDPSKGFLSNAVSFAKNPSMQGAMDYIETHPYASAGAAYGLYNLLKPKPKEPPKDVALIRPYEFERTQNPQAYAVSPTADSSERTYFTENFTPLEPYEAPGPEYKRAASGGITSLAVGGPVEQMAAMNSVGANTGYPMAGINTPMYSNPMIQRPEAVNVLAPSSDAGVGAYSGEPKFAEGGELKTVGEYKYSFDPKTNVFTQIGTPRYAENTGPVGYPGFGGNKVEMPVERPALATGSKTAGGITAPVGGPGIAALMPQAQQTYSGPIIPAYQSPEQQLGLTNFYEMMNRRLGEMSGYATGGSISNLGDYSDGGRLLKGPGDGVSDSIPAVIGERQPARLADGEFVIPARIVSELGNGSTEAGARKLYAMMDRVQKARRKTVGRDRVATNTRADKHLPA